MSVKITEETGKQIERMAFEEVPNTEIAQRLGIPVKDVYAYRSRKGITMTKVQAAKGQAPAATPEPRSCKNCHHCACHAAGRLDAGPCKDHITLEARIREYQLAWKENFLTNLGHKEWGLDKQAYNRLRALLDELIPKKEASRL